MSSQSMVFDVSAEFLMDVAKAVASSPYPLKKNDLLNSFKKSGIYVQNAISQCLQLGLINEKTGEYISSDRYADQIRRSERSQLHITLRQALQSFPPFLLYLDFVSKGYPLEQSVNMVTGIFRIQSRKDIVEKAFRNWGLQTSLIIAGKAGKFTIPEGKKGLPTEYVESLMKALRADLQAKIFLIETMSSPAYKYLSESGIAIDDLSDALVNYESDPKNSANKASQVFEHFIFKFGKDAGANVTKGNGIIQYADTIKTEKNDLFLRNHKHICYAVGGLRNMAHHDPDKETGKPWSFTPQGAIITTLIVPAMIRSIYSYWMEKKLEF